MRNMFDYEIKNCAQIKFINSKSERQNHFMIDTMRVMILCKFHIGYIMLRLNRTKINIIEIIRFDTSI